MADDERKVFEAALTETRKGLNQSEIDQIQNLDSVQGFLNHVDALNGKYSNKRSSVFFDRLRPALDWLWQFNSAVHSFLQASPDHFVLVWGSLSIIIQLCQSYSKRLDLLIDGLEAIKATQPRFNLYSSHLTYLCGGILRSSLFSYHSELLHFFLSAIKFFQKPFYLNFWHTSLRRVQGGRLRRLESLARTIDLEAASVGQLRILELVAPSHPTLRNPDNMFLGAIPYDNLPRRNCSFYGREAEIRAISEALRPDSSSRDLSVALHGLPGSGKSDLAAEYAYRKYRDDSYQTVLWVSSETEVKLAESVGSISRALGIIDESVQHDRERQKQALLQWLSKTNKPGQKDSPRVKWLVVFDNVATPSVLEPYWGVVSRGSVIITCRSPEVARKLPEKEIHVDVFDSHSGPGFLLSLISSGNHRSRQNSEIATTISEAVGNHPLALNMIGCHVRRCGKSLRHFLRDNPDFERDFLFRQDLGLGVEYIDEPKVNDAFVLHAAGTSMLPTCSPSRTLLYLLAFLDPDGAPLALFVGHTPESMLCDGPDDPNNFPELDEALHQPFQDSSMFDQARSTLLDLGMITMDDNNAKIKCHRLTQLATAHRMSPEEISFALNKLVFFLNSAFPAQLDGQPLLSRWEKCDEFAASVLSVLEYCMRYKDLMNPPVLLSEVVCRCSWYYYEHGWFITATKLADQAIEFCEHILATGRHPGYTPWYLKDMISHQFNTKGAIGMKSPQSDHGLSGYQQALKIRLENRREGNVEDEMWIGAAMGNLAISLMAVGRAEEALPKLLELVYREDMKTNKDLYLSNLCLCYYLLGRFDEALDTSNAAAACIERQWGDKDARMATILYYVSNIRESIGDYVNAQYTLEACLEIRTERMQFHPETGLTHHRMGVWLSRRGQTIQAIKHLDQASRILASCESHPGAVCRTALELEALVQGAGDDRLSEACLRLFNQSRQKIVDVDTASLGSIPANYDRFITVGLR